MAKSSSASAGNAARLCCGDCGKRCQVCSFNKYDVGVCSGVMAHITGACQAARGWVAPSAGFGAFPMGRGFFVTTKRKRYHLKTKELFFLRFCLIVGMSRFFLPGSPKPLDLCSRLLFCRDKIASLDELDRLMRRDDRCSTQKRSCIALPCT